LIDFGFAALREDYAEADWQAVTAAERATLVKELNEATDEGSVAPTMPEQLPKQVDRPIAGVKRAFDARYVSR